MHTQAATSLSHVSEMFQNRYAYNAMEINAMFCWYCTHLLNSNTVTIFITTLTNCSQTKPLSMLTYHRNLSFWKQWSDAEKHMEPNSTNIPTLVLFLLLFFRDVVVQSKWDPCDKNVPQIQYVLKVLGCLFPSSISLGLTRFVLYIQWLTDYQGACKWKGKQYWQFSIVSC